MRYLQTYIEREFVCVRLQMCDRRRSERDCVCVCVVSNQAGAGERERERISNKRVCACERQTQRERLFEFVCDRESVYMEV